MMRALLARELRLAWRSGAEILNPLWFFLIVITLFPFGVGAAPQLLAQIAPGVVWVAALLAALLVMDRLFRDDWQDGSLEQLMLLPTPLVAVVLVKVVAHWMMSGLPLLIVSPLAALLLGMSLHDAGVLALTLLLGTPTLSFLGAVGVGLTVGLKRGGVLLSLLVLPLAVPLLIFATAACQAAAAGLPVGGYLAMLAAFLTASATLCPFATAAALRLMEKPAAATLSSRREDTVSRMCFTFSSGGIRSSRGRDAVCSRTRPAAVHSDSSSSAAGPVASTSAQRGNTRMSPNVSRVTPRAMRLPRMSRWVRESSS